MKQKCQHLQLMKENKIMSKEKAKKIIENLNKTINKLEGNRGPIGLIRTDMFSSPTASKSKLIKKRDELITKYNIKWK
jgi:hypothetical protein